MDGREQVGTKGIACRYPFQFSETKACPLQQDCCCCASNTAATFFDKHRSIMTRKRRFLGIRGAVLCSKQHPSPSYALPLWFNSRRRKAAAVTNNILDSSGSSSTGSVHGTTISAGAAPTILDSPAAVAGPKADELRAWQLAMIELARRHSMPQVCMYM